MESVVGICDTRSFCFLDLFSLIVYSTQDITAPKGKTVVPHTLDSTRVIHEKLQAHIVREEAGQERSSILSRSID